MYMTMDRYNADWSMVERGWKAHVLGEGRKFESATKAIETYRAEVPGLLDQDMQQAKRKCTGRQALCFYARCE